MRTAASSDVLRGAIGRARRTDPPSGGLFHVWSSDFWPGSDAAPYNLQRPVRTPDELPTVRALGRAAAAVLLLPAVLRRGGTRPRPASRHDEGVRERQPRRRRAGTDRRRRGRRTHAARRARGALRPRLRALTFVSDDAREASGYLARSGGEDVDWWRELRLDLEREPSGIASAVFEATAMTVYDTAELRRGQPPARRCRRSEERRVRPAPRRGAGDRRDLASRRSTSRGSSRARTSR